MNLSVKTLWVSRHPVLIIIMNPIGISAESKSSDGVCVRLMFLLLTTSPDPDVSLPFSGGFSTLWLDSYQSEPCRCSAFVLHHRAKSGN